MRKNDYYEPYAIDFRRFMSRHSQVVSNLFCHITSLGNLVTVRHNMASQLIGTKRRIKL